VLQSLVATGESAYIWLAVFAVMMSLIGSFYYLRIVKVMYFDEPRDNSAIVAAPGAHAMLSVNGLAVLVLGVFPGGLMAICSQAVLKALAT
jgi:NADH-quinone oxidoreductase subunit N